MWISPWNRIRNVIQSILFIFLLYISLMFQLNAIVVPLRRFNIINTVISSHFVETPNPCDIFHKHNVSMLVHVKLRNTIAEHENQKKRIIVVRFSCVPSIFYSRTEQIAKTIFCRNWEHTTCAIRNSANKQPHIRSFFLLLVLMTWKIVCRSNNCDALFCDIK